MNARAVACLSLAAVLSGCGGQRAPLAHHLPPDIATPPASPGLLRLVRSGGTAQLLAANTLTPRQMLITGGLPSLARILGTSGVEDQSVYAADNAGHLVVIDLQAHRWHVVTTSARDLVASPDGIVLGIDSAHHPVRIASRQTTVFKATIDKSASLFKGTADQLLVTGNRAGTLQVFNATSEMRHIAMPSGRVASTWAGDLVTVTTDSGVSFIDPSGKAAARFVKIKGHPTVAAFSPSGHRLYLARKEGSLVVIDRFQVMVERSRRGQAKETTLGGPADRLRVDRSGRWLLAHGLDGDSTSVIDLSDGSSAGKVDVPWADDLPQVVDGKTLVARHKNDLVAFDLSSGKAVERSLLGGGAADLYVMLPWAPKTAGNPTTAVAAAPTAAPVATDTTARPAAVTPAPTAAATTSGVPAPAGAKAAAADTAGKIFIQVSSSQNPDFAQTFAKQLKDVGFPARVLDPRTSDEGYRVLIGPYHTRDEADAVGKRLGRSYFIVTPGSGDT